jgi:Zn-finger nucleic acid-binding protein
MESTTWRCPQCQLPLHRTETGPLVEWRCPPCSLSWVTRTNLLSIVQKSGLDQLTKQLEQAPASARQLLCPACHTPSFRTIPAQGAELDLCTTCHGLILDPGEAQRIVSDSYWKRSGADVKGDLAAGAIELLLRGIFSAW